MTHDMETPPQGEGLRARELSDRIVRLETHHEHISEKFLGVDNRFATFDTRLSNMDAKLDLILQGQNRRAGAMGLISTLTIGAGVAFWSLVMNGGQWVVSHINTR